MAPPSTNSANIFLEASPLLFELIQRGTYNPDLKFGEFVLAYITDTKNNAYSFQPDWSDTPFIRYGDDEVPVLSDGYKERLKNFVFSSMDLSLTNNVYFWVEREYLKNSQGSFILENNAPVSYYQVVVKITNLSQEKYDDIVRQCVEKEHSTGASFSLTQ